MNSKLYKIVIFVILALFSLNGCAPNKISEENRDSLVVYASFYPIYFAAEQIGGDQIDLFTVIPFGSEPHDYEPSAREIARVEDSDIFIYNGVDLEPWAEKLANRLEENGIKTLNLSDFVELINISEHNSDHEEDDHNHGVYDPHIWLEPNNMDKIGYQIMLEFSKLDEENEQYYKENYDKFSLRLMELDNKFEEELKNRYRNKILVSHEAFGYLTRRYGLEQISVTGITPHEEPSPKTIASLLDTIENEKFEYIFLESLASPRVVDLLVEEGNLKVLELNPIAGLTAEQQEESENYFTLMEKNLENLKRALVK